jgi:hypothetical protein
MMDGLQGYPLATLQIGWRCRDDFADSYRIYFHSELVALRQTFVRRGQGGLVSPGLVELERSRFRRKTIAMVYTRATQQMECNSCAA